MSWRRYSSKNKKQVWTQSQQQNCTFKTYKWSVKHQTGREFLYHALINVTIHTERRICLSMCLTQRELQTLSHTNSPSLRRIKMETTSCKHFRFYLLSAHFHQKVPMCATWTTSRYNTAKGFIHTVNPKLSCSASSFKLLPSLHCIKIKASFINSSERPEQVPKLSRSIFYSLEQDWQEINFSPQRLLLS